MGAELVVPKSLVGGVVGGVITESMSPGGGVFSPPLLLSERTVSDLAEEFETSVDGRSALCLPSADDNEDD